MFEITDFTTASEWERYVYVCITTGEFLQQFICSSLFQIMESITKGSSNVKNAQLLPSLILLSWKTKCVLLYLVLQYSDHYIFQFFGWYAIGAYRYLFNYRAGNNPIQY